MRTLFHWLVPVLAIALLTTIAAAGCGSSVDKKNNDENNANNGKIVIDDDNNGATNNGAANNGAANNGAANNGSNNGVSDDCPMGQIKAQVNDELGCYDPCVAGECEAGFRCISGICIVDDGPEPECTTRADCRAAQECEAGECRNHASCSVADGYDGTYNCAYFWQGCNDGKEYRGECEEADGAWLCECVVNDVLTDTFSVDEDPCDYNDIPTGHRLFNENCGWLVPEAR